MDFSTTQLGLLFGTFYSNILLFFSVVNLILFQEILHTKTCDLKNNRGHKTTPFDNHIEKMLMYSTAANITSYLCEVPNVITLSNHVFITV